MGVAFVVSDVRQTHGWSNFYFHGSDKQMDHDDISVWLQQVPWNLLVTEYNRRVVARRGYHSTGRPKLLNPCDKCEALLGAREMRKHSCPSAQTPVFVQAAVANKLLSDQPTSASR